MKKIKAEYAFLRYIRDGREHADTIELHEITMRPIAGTRDAIYSGRRITILEFTRL